MSLKELMNITSGEQQVLSAINKGNETDSLSQDFQMKQIDRIIEAIALTLP